MANVQLWEDCHEAHHQISRYLRNMFSLSAWFRLGGGYDRRRNQIRHLWEDNLYRDECRRVGVGGLRLGRHLLGGGRLRPVQDAQGRSLAWNVDDKARLFVC